MCRASCCRKQGRDWVIAPDAGDAEATVLVRRSLAQTRTAKGGTSRALHETDEAMRVAEQDGQASPLLVHGDRTPLGLWFLRRSAQRLPTLRPVVLVGSHSWGYPRSSKLALSSDERSAS